MIEARCSGCGETFNPNDAADLTHAEKASGEECGALGVVSGSWTDQAPMTPTISTARVLDGNLPGGVTGVHWADTGWTECRAHLTDPSWAVVDRSDMETGVALYGEVDCDACREATL